MSFLKGKAFPMTLAAGVALCATVTVLLAQNSPAPTGRIVLGDDLQRSARQYAFQLSAASGAKRGEEIYYFKCWVCHNEYTVKSGTKAPLMRDLYPHPAATSGNADAGQAATGKAAAGDDAVVAQMIKEGAKGMPAYKYSLTDADIADLIEYFKSDKCCFDSENPPPNPWYKGAKTAAALEVKNNLRGGPTGVVKNKIGETLEGVMVQLISQETAIRTTVYSNEQGQYEFPKLPAGTYTLRIPRPLEFKPYRREAVRVAGADAMAEIVLEPVTDAEWLPPTPDIAGQLSGSEWLDNLPGTGEEKRLFVKSCNWCHSYQLVFRARFDEAGWAAVIDRMSHYAGSTLINRNPEGRNESARETMLVKWLARVRGPESKDPAFKPFPGPRGPATRVIVTEYELPRLWLATHDVSGNSKGEIFYSPHRSPYIGRVNPVNGVVREYKVPPTPGANPGIHWIMVQPDDTVWMSQNWAHKLFHLEPESGEFRYIIPPNRADADGRARPYNTPMGGNWTVAKNGIIWKARDHQVVSVDPKTGKYITSHKIKNTAGTYGSAISPDQRYFAGGAWGDDWVIAHDIKTGEVIELKTRTVNQGPGRGHFDPFGNGWFGGKAGALVKIDINARRLKEYFAPDTFASFYEANADKNGEIWAGTVQSGRYVRLDPKTERWIVYVLPEPYSHNRESWIDNSTTPVSLWYADHNGYLVHIQPLE